MNLDRARLALQFEQRPRFATSTTVIARCVQPAPKPYARASEAVAGLRGRDQAPPETGVGDSATNRRFGAAGEVIAVLPANFAVAAPLTALLQRCLSP